MITREIRSNFYLTPIFNKRPLCIKRFNILLCMEETLVNTDTLSHCFLLIFPTPMQFFKLYCAEYHVYLKLFMSKYGFGQSIFISEQ